jgi:hypothetical protein
MRTGQRRSGTALASCPSTAAITLDFPDPLGPMTATFPWRVDQRVKASAAVVARRSTLLVPLQDAFLFKLS